MVKQLTEKQESYVKGLLDAGLSYREALDKFFEKYKRLLSLDTISRISKRSKKIKVLPPQNEKISTVREIRIISKVIKENRWQS